MIEEEPMFLALFMDDGKRHMSKLNPNEFLGGRFDSGHGRTLRRPHRVWRFDNGEGRAGYAAIHSYEKLAIAAVNAFREHREHMEVA